MKIRCHTLFDITETGVKHNFNQHRGPFNDRSGKSVEDLHSWTYSRNQQRNWETINQLISLRVLPQDITSPRQDGHKWWFDFSIDSSTALSTEHNPVGMLLDDSKDVPMLIGLGESNDIISRLQPGVNIWFDVLEP